MYDQDLTVVDVDVRGWVESAKADPILYRDRQVTEIVLAAIGIAPTLQSCLVLKGGTLMAIAFNSERVTGDVDFSAMAQPEGFEDLLRAELEAALPKAAVKLGYLDLVCKVQGVKRKPRSDVFEHADFPLLEIRIGSAERGSKQETSLNQGKASRILFIEITFRDQVYAFQELHLTDANVAVQAFTIEELIAEKLRALLQQPIRNRNRRQDVYDIAFLLDQHELKDETRAIILETLIEKCRTRSIEPTPTSFDDPEIRARAEKEWETLKLELKDLPPFDERFAKVVELYHRLPWPGTT